ADLSESGQALRFRLSRASDHLAYKLREPQRISARPPGLLSGERDEGGDDGVSRIERMAASRARADGDRDDQCLPRRPLRQEAALVILSLPGRHARVTASRAPAHL